MITNELLAFVKEELAKGTTEDEIKKALIEGGGWSDADIREAFDAVGVYSRTYQSTMANALVPETPVTPAPPPSFQPPLQQKVIQHAPLGMGTMGVGGEISNPNLNPDPPGMRERLVLDMKAATPSFPQPTPSITPRPVGLSSAKASLPGDFPPPPTFPPPTAKPFTSPIASAPSPSFSPDLATSPTLGNPPPNFLSPYLNPPARDTVKMEKRAEEKRGHGFLYFLIFLIVLLLILGGAAFAYIKGVLPPSISVPFLDSFKTKLSGTNSGASDETAQGGSGLAMSDPSLIPAPPPDSEQAPPPYTEPEEPPEQKYYNDRVKIVLPSGSPVSATTIASSIASELRGKIASCEYSATENSCVITVPAKNETELQKTVDDLKKDKRLKDASLVPM